MRAQASPTRRAIRSPASASTNGGDSWTLLPGSQLFATRSIAKVVAVPGQPNHLYAAVALGIRGYASVTGGSFSRTGACTQTATTLGCQDGPDQAPLGLWESIDGGVTFTLAWDVSTTSIRGVTDVGLDPSDATCVYASAFQLGIWRRCAAVDGTPTFKQVFRPPTPASGVPPNTDRTQFDLTTVRAGTSGVAAGTRIYAVNGQTGSPPAKHRRRRSADHSLSKTASNRRS